MSLLVFMAMFCQADFVHHDGLIQTSIVRLLAHPDAYNGKRVEIIGYYYSGLEVSAVFLSKEAAETGNVQLAIWVSPPSKGTNNLIETLKEGFVHVRGAFKHDEKLGSGHLGMWPGEISQVEVFKRVKPRK